MAEDDFWSGWGDSYSEPSYEPSVWSVPDYDAGAYYDYAEYLPSYSEAVAPTYDYPTYGYSLAQPGAYNATFGWPEQPETYYGGMYDAYQPAGAITGYDPSTNTYFDRANNPVQPQYGGTGGAQTPGTQISGVRPPNPALVAEPSGTPSSGGDWMKMVNDFLKTPLGGILGAAGIGGAGLGIARGLAGPMPTLPPPQLAPGNPINAAGQGTIAQMFADQAAREAGYQAGQAPGYEAIRNKAMTLIPGQMNPVTVENYNDPVQAALRAELMSTLQGGASPLVEENLRKNWNTLQNTMYRRLGPDWELSSPGQEAKQAFDRNAAIARDESKRGMVSAYSPLEQSRGQFAYTAPVTKAQALGGEQRAYVDTLSRSSALGRMDPYQLQTGLGGNPDQYRALMTNLGSQAQTVGFNADVADRTSLMQGVGGLTGTLSGRVASGGFGGEDYAKKLYEKMYGLSV